MKEIALFLVWFSSQLDHKWVEEWWFSIHRLVFPKDNFLGQEIQWSITELWRAWRPHITNFSQLLSPFAKQWKEVSLHHQQSHTPCRCSYICSYSTDSNSTHCSSPPQGLFKLTGVHRHCCVSCTCELSIICACNLCFLSLQKPWPESWTARETLDVSWLHCTRLDWWRVASTTWWTLFTNMGDT